MTQIRELQKRVWANKLAKGFNTANVNQEFNCLYGEVAEAYDAWFKQRNDVGQELADVVIYTLALATMLDLSLEDEILKKIEVNEKRVYVNNNGVLIKEDMV